MPEINLRINGENLKMNASKICSGMNPRTLRHAVYIMDDDTGKTARLLCENFEEAKALVHQIRDGKITDLTGYSSEWN